MALCLGVDCSTTATKVEVRDTESGSLVTSGTAPHPRTVPPRCEQEPTAWWEALVAATKEAFAGREVLARSVEAVAVAAQQHGLVVLDEGRRALRPAKLWNDTESAPDAAWLVERLGGPAAWAEACGSVPTAAFTITKLSWLHRNEPEVLARASSVCLPHDWLTAMLTGVLTTDRGDASGTGFWSPADGWRTDLLDLVDNSRPWAEMLPEVSAGRVGELHPSAASALGLPPGVAVGSGTGDNMAAALRLGLAPGDVAVSLGTSGTVFCVSDGPTADPTGAVAGFADATGRFLPLVCTLNATRVTDAVARLLAVDHATLADTALSCPPGAGGLVLVPYLDGERTPDRPQATGLLAGIRSDVTRPQLARAAFEGVAFGLLDGLDALTATVPGAAGGRMLLVGGGARSPAYRLILATLAAREVEVPDAADHVAAGACVLASAALSGRSPADVAAEWGYGSSFSVEPDPGADPAALRAAYAAARDR